MHAHIHKNNQTHSHMCVHRLLHVVYVLKTLNMAANWFVLKNRQTYITFSSMLWMKIWNEWWARKSFAREPTIIRWTLRECDMPFFEESFISIFFLANFFYLSSFFVCLSKKCWIAIRISSCENSQYANDKMNARIVWWPMPNGPSVVFSSVSFLSSLFHTFELNLPLRD